MLSKNIKSKLKILLVSLVFYVPIAFLGNLCWQNITSRVRFTPILAQRVVYSSINRREEPPRTMEGICTLVSEISWLSGKVPKYIEYYDPNAWQNHNRILFMKNGAYRWVTFGDGSQVILKYWYGPLQNEETGRYEFKSLSAEDWGKDWTHVVAFGIAAMLIYTVVSGIFLRTKQVKTTKANGDLNKSISVPSQEDR